MANAAIYYYPEGSTGILKIDLGGSLSSLSSRPVVEQDTAQAYSGSISRAVYTGYHAVDVGIELILDQALAAKLEALEAHLKRGGVCSVVEDADHTIAGYLEYLPERYEDRIYLQSNQFRDIEAGAVATTIGDYIRIQSPSPKFLRERVIISDLTDLRVDLVDPLTEEYTGEDWVFLCDARFWPYLMLRPGSETQPILTPTTGTRITWEFRAQLFEPPALLEAAADLPSDDPWGGPIDQGSDPFDPSGIGTYDDLLTGGVIRGGTFGGPLGGSLVGF